MSQIGPGPNYRPPWQQQQPGNSRAGENRPMTEPTAVPGAAADSVVNHSQNLTAQAGLAGLMAAGLGQELTLASDQLLVLLRNLLQLPKEMAQLMAMLAEADPATGKALLQTLLETEVSLPLDALQNLVLSHADTAQDKLIKLLQSSNMSPGGPSAQLGELLSTLGELVGKAQQSPAQSLHAAINLYLPFYPLHPPQAFTLRYETPSGGDGEQDGEGQNAEQLVLFMETLSLGQFKITLAAQGRAPMQAIVFHEAAAAPFESDITRQTSQAMGGDGRLSLVFIPMSGPSTAQGSGETPKSEEMVGEMPSDAKSPKQSVGLHPTGGLSMAALYAAYALIRVIFELDGQNQSSQRRAAML